MITETATTTRVIYTCKRKTCKHIWAFEYLSQDKHLYRILDGKKEWHSDQYVYGCPKCHSLNIDSNRVTGKVSAKPCNAKCMSAKSGACECACGGENHGRSHL